MSTHTNIKRRGINLSIQEDIIAAAKKLKLNMSKAAETGISLAIREAQQERWLSENRSALNAHNDRIDRDGPLLKPGWESDS